MIENRPVPPDTILPHAFYRDVAEAIAWLSKRLVSKRTIAMAIRSAEPRYVSATRGSCSAECEREA
jgi:hypothetical protein